MTKNGKARLATNPARKERQTDLEGVYKESLRRGEGESFFRANLALRAI